MHPGQVRPGLPRGGTGAGPARRAGGLGRRDGQGRTETRRPPSQPGDTKAHILARRHEGPRLGPETRRLPSQPRDTHAPISARLFCASPQRREGQARRSGSLPPCACGLTQAKKRFCFVFLPSWELISGRLPSGDVFIVKNVKRAEPSATQSPKENPEGRVPAAPCGPRSSPPSAHQCLPFVGHHSQDDFTNHELSLSEQWEAGRVEKRCLCAR